jgi:Ca-activated chloride channel family protein
MFRSRRSSHSGGLWDRLFIASLLFFPIAVGGQSTSQSTISSGNGGEETTFSVTAELVVLPVNVTDAGGNFVSGLTAQNFRVYEDGRPQTITLFQREDIPVTVGLIVDHSRSMGPKLSAVATAVSGFARSSNREDEMFVVDFSDRVWPEFFGGQPFTSDVKVLENAVASVPAQGQTALYDAVYEGLERLRFGHRQKKALIIVSDGGDNASRRKYKEILALARQSQAMIYAIGLVGETGQEENPRVLERLCRDSGGLVFFPHNVEAVGEISNRIAHDLRQQYTVGYAPEKKKIGTGAFRKIQVKVSAPGRSKMHVRTRTSYSVAGEKHSPLLFKGPA